MHGDGRLPLILTTHSQPALEATTVVQQPPRFLREIASTTEQMHHEQRLSNPSQLYTSIPNSVSIRLPVQGAVAGLGSRNDPRIPPPHGQLQFQNSPRETVPFAAAVPREINTNHEMAIASHHRAVAVADLTRAPASASLNLTGIQRNPHLQPPQVVMDTIRGSHIQRVRGSTPTISLNQSQQQPTPLVVSTGIRRDQPQQPTDLSKAIRSSAAAAVAAITQRTLPPSIVKEVVNQPHLQYTSTIRPTASLEHLPHSASLSFCLLNTSDAADE